MSVPFASSSSPAGSTDLSAAIAALTAELDDRPIDGGDYDHITPILSHLTIGHLRQIAAALAAPYVPGMVEVDRDAWIHALDSATAMLTTWSHDAADAARSEHYFAAVQS